MSLGISGTIFQVNQYGQDRLVMDYFAIQDPFQQVLPIKITNNWSGGLYFMGQLQSGANGGVPAWYSNYSGVAFSGSNAGAVPLAAGASDTYTMTWTISASGAAFYTSSPNTDNLTLGILAFSSGFLSGTIASGSFNFKSVLFNRYSGVIKVFGDQYSNDQPTPTATQQSGVALGSGTFNYAISYFLSGWESDIGAPATVTINSGFAVFVVTWTGVAGVTQYAVWRWSGASDFTVVNPMSGTMDLIAIVSGLSITDSGITPLQTGNLRARSWINNTTLWAADTATYLSPPQSRKNLGSQAATDSHFYQLGKNLSGTFFLGPFYVVVHRKTNSAGSIAFALQQVAGANNTTSGSIIADPNVFLLQTKTWNRLAFYVSGVSSGQFTITSGEVIIQQLETGAATINFDDVFIVAVS